MKIIENNLKGAYNDLRYLYNNIYVDYKNIIDASDLEELTEAINFVDENKKGGMIIFSTEVNCNGADDNIIQRIKQKIESLKNRLYRMSKIDSIAQKYNLSGWTVGKFVHGRYTDTKTGKVYDEKSLCIELVNIDNNTLYGFAEDLCKEFNQQAVLVKNYNDGTIAFISID